MLPGGHVVAAGTDLFISVWNLHHSPQLWERPEAFDPDRCGTAWGRRSGLHGVTDGNCVDRGLYVNAAQTWPRPTPS